MPLDYVTSNAGHPMLVVDQYTYHKHSAHPRTGRTNWRCSRRRVKDIRCTSSCNTIGDTCSVPSVHDPNCRPLSTQDLSALQERSLSSRVNNSAFNYKSESQYNNENQPNDCTISQIFNETSNQNNQNAELDDDDLGHVLDEFDENNEGIDQCSDNKQDASLGSIIKNIKPDTILNNSSQANATLDMMNSDENKNLRFVTSKVGHPMLVMDNHTFHKHSANPKTGRVNWRCARRRVKDIRCPSSCFTEKGDASRPTPHHINCHPLSDQILNDYQNKRHSVAYKRDATAYKREANGYTPLNNQVNLNGTNGLTNCGYDENNEDTMYDDYENTGDMDSFYNNSPIYNNIPADEQYQENGDYNENEYNQNGEDFIEYDDSNNMNDENLVHTPDDLHDITEPACQEYNVDDYSNNPETFSKLIADLNNMKQRERTYRDRLTNTNNELEALRRNSSMKIQALKWKSKMVDIDMYSMKASLHQAKTQNVNLRNLVDEMMAKLSPDSK